MLKLFAIFTMIIDHAGFVYDLPVWRVLGRVCMPLIVYMCIRGLTYTSNPVRYFSRLFQFGVIAQLPYILLFHPGEFLPLNFLFTLSAVVAVFSCPELARRFPVVYMLVVAGVLVGLDLMIGLFGSNIITVFLIAAVFYYVQHPYWMIALYSFVVLVTAPLIDSVSVFMLLALPFFFLPNTRFILPSRFFYWFYPVHLGLLCLL